MLLCLQERLMCLLLWAPGLNCHSSEGSKVFIFSKCVDGWFHHATHLVHPDNEDGRHPRISNGMYRQSETDSCPGQARLPSIAHTKAKVHRKILSRI